MSPLTLTALGLFPFSGLQGAIGQPAHLPRITGPEASDVGAHLARAMLRAWKKLLGKVSAAAPGMGQAHST